MQGVAVTMTRRADLETFDVAIGESAIHGRGVFATRRFGIDDVVEVCPVLEVPADQRLALEATSLNGYVFEWADDGVGVALGCGSLYNHSWDANAGYEVDFDAGEIRVYAVRPIDAGEEVTINYTGVPDGRGELWFVPATDEPVPDRRRRRRSRSL